MSRHFFRGLLRIRFRNFGSKNDEPVIDNFFDKDVAYEREYYYRQDSELSKILKEKTEAEVKAMRMKIGSMRKKIEEYNRDIDENLRLLKDLEKDKSDGSKKKT